MKTFTVALGILAIVGCSHVPYANNRPATLNPPASDLIPRCTVTVKFNEDEQSVPESDYLDSMFCLGLMEGIVATNRVAHEQTGRALFCIPAPGIKNWLAAKAVVEYAKVRPDLLEMEETEFVIAALADKFPCSESTPSIQRDT